MIVEKKANREILFTGKMTKNSNGCASISLPFEESKDIDLLAEYLIVIKGPINEKRTAYNRIVISL